MVDIVSADTFKKALKHKHKPLVLDVRTSPERRALYLDLEDWHRPLHEIDFDTESDDFARMGGEAGIFVLCRKGGRAQKAAEALEARGLENVHVVDGGVDACDMAGIKCVRDPEGPDEATCQQAVQDSVQQFEEGHKAS